MSTKIQNFPTINNTLKGEAPNLGFISIFSSVRVLNGTYPKRILPAEEFFAKCSDPANEKLIQLTAELRALKAEDEAKYKEVRKKRSSAFCVGEWPERGELKTPSPLLGFDIDGGNEGTYIFNLEAAPKSPFIYRMEQSLGGGARIWVKAAFLPAQREATYLYLCEHFSEVFSLPIKRKGDPELRVEHVDATVGDLARLWFPAYTPANQIYQNEASEVFHLPANQGEEKDNRRGGEQPHRPGKYLVEFTNDEKVNDVVRQIVERGQDITQGVKDIWFPKILLPLAHEYGEAGRHLAHLVSQFYQNGKGYSRAETDQEFNRALAKEKGVVTIGSFLDHARARGITYDVGRIRSERKSNGLPAAPAGGALEEAARPTDPEEEEEEFFKFYNVERNKAEAIEKIHVDYVKLVELMKVLGFRRYDKDEGFFTVQIKDNIVRQCSENELIDSFEKYIIDFEGELPEEVPKNMLLNKIYGAISNYFSKHILGRLKPDKPIVFNTHTRDKAFFYYQNGFVEVSSSGVELKPYSELENCIWANQVLPRDFKPMQPTGYKNFSFFRFVKNISNCWAKHPHYKRKNENPDLARLDSFLTVIGYLLHAFFNTSLKAVIFTDSKIEEEGEANGGSGKTLLVKALGHVLNNDFDISKTYKELNGKDFNAKDKNKYQELGLDTVLVHLNDAKRNFQFDDLYNDITEGFRVEGKYKDPFKVKAKLAISTNQTIQIKGASSKRRCIEVELAEYYDDQWKPEDEFGQWFFTDWTKEEWAQFDAFMMDCISLYFRKGLIEPDSINLEERKKIEETSPEFVRWMEEKEDVFRKEPKQDKKELFEDFQSRYPDYSTHKWFTQRRFTSWLRNYCLYDKEYEPVTKKNEPRSNGVDYIVFEFVEG